MKLLTKNGIENVAINQHKSGLWYREGSCDDLTIQECLKNYKNIDFNNKIVLDLGANIGGFSYLALKGGAKEVISVEPDINNFSMLEKNLNEFGNRSKKIKAAISNKNDIYLDFYIGTGKAGPSIASLRKTSGRKIQKVKNLNAKDLFNDIKPDILKIDIEGGEYDIIEWIPTSVKEILIEWHVANPRPLTLNLFNKWYPFFISNGWKIKSEKKREVFKKLKHYKDEADFMKKTGTQWPGIPWFFIDGHYIR